MFIHLPVPTIYIYVWLCLQINKNLNSSRPLARVPLYPGLGKRPSVLLFTYVFSVVLLNPSFDASSLQRQDGKVVATALEGLGLG